LWNTLSILGEVEYQIYVLGGLATSDGLFCNPPGLSWGHPWPPTPPIGLESYCDFVFCLFPFETTLDFSFFNFFVILGLELRA
jgi:hypothetical protein